MGVGEAQWKGPKNSDWVGLEGVAVVNKMVVIRKGSPSEKWGATKLLRKCNLSEKCKGKRKTYKRFVGHMVCTWGGGGRKGSSGRTRWGAQRTTWEKKDNKREGNRDKTSGAGKNAPMILWIGKKRACQSQQLAINCKKSKGKKPESDPNSAVP